MTETVYGWHFVSENKKLGYGDGRTIRKGGTLTVDVEPVLCAAGLHASPRAIDALGYAPGPIACFVQLGGAIVGPSNDHPDKMVATERTVIAYCDFRKVYRDYIRDTLVFRQEPIAVLLERSGLPEHAHAVRAIQMDTASFADIQTVFDASWAAARAAAWDASWDAARAALNERLEGRLFAAMKIADPRLEI